MFFIIGLTIFSIVRLVPYLKQVFTGAGPMECDCVHHASFITNHPYLSGIVMVLFLMFSAFLLNFIYRVIKSVYSTRRFARTITMRIVRPQTKLSEILSSVSLQDKVFEVDLKHSEIFCCGFIRPRIYVSSRLLRRISKNQLRAVLLHEKNHLESFDPLKIFIANVMRKSFPFIPGLKSIVDQFEVNIELSADARATNNFKEIRPLGNALMKLIESSGNKTVSGSKNLAVTFLSITEVRVNQLINQSQDLTVKHLIPKIFMVMVILIAVLFGMYGNHIFIAEASQSDAETGQMMCHGVPIETEYNTTINDACGYNSVMSCDDTNETPDNLCG